jgi:O-methyltransferase domain
MSARSLPVRELDGPLFASALTLNPSDQIFRSLAVGHCVGVLARIGAFAELARIPSTVDDLAQRFTLQPRTLALILDVVAGAGLLVHADGRYSTAPATRGQLDPDSPTSVVTFLSHLLDHTPLWDDLEFVAAGGQSAGGVPADDDEPGWLRRVRGQHEYLRRAGAQALDSVVLPTAARSIIDVGGSHGWFSTVLCRRSPLLSATVIDRAPAVAVGREIVWEAGLDHVVQHRAGDIYTADLGGPHDVAICLPLMYGLRDAQAISLLERIRAALRPGGVILIPRPAARSRADRPGLAAIELYLHLDSGVTSTTTEGLAEQLRTAGFGAAIAHPVPAAPEFCVYVATAI